MKNNILTAVQVACLFSLVLLPGVLSAGENPAPFFTGNAKVDLFGDRLTLLTPGLVTGDTSLQYLSGSVPGKEKSPWLAGLLSLAIPGAGEVYSKSYVKGAVFFAVEAASWFFVYHYNKKGDQQTQAYQDYANQHWSAVRYTEWTLNNIGVLTNGYQSRTQYESRVFDSDYDPLAPCPPPFTCVVWYELNKMEDSIGLYAPPGGNGYTHRLPNYGEQQYYELIGKYDEFSRGWDDADQSAIALSDLPLKNNSQRFVDYQLMRAESNHQYDVASTWVSVVIVNHVLSALDAYWTATRYNKSLHAEAHMNMIPTQFGLIPYTEMKLSYSF